MTIPARFMKPDPKSVEIFGVRRLKMLAIDRFERLEKFLEERKGDTVPEATGNAYFMQEGIDVIQNKIKIGDKILDVGCGKGVALKMFRYLGTRPIGITINEEDKAIAEAEGDDVRIMDMSFLEFDDNFFDGIWARHCLEHSIFPYYTLHEFNRVLKPGGWMYVEVPGINTCSQHELNRNHYSVLTTEMWASLILRTNFQITGSYALSFNLPTGKEIYYRILAEKMT